MGSNADELHVFLAFLFFRFFRYALFGMFYDEI